MEIRRLNKKTDLKEIERWFEVYDWDGFDPENMSEETSFVALKDGEILALSYWIEPKAVNIGYLGITVGNPDVKSKTKAVMKVLDAVLDDMREKKVKYMYYGTSSKQFVDAFLVRKGFKYQEGVVGALSLDGSDIDFLV